MATRWSGQIRKGMDVFDVDGDKIGSVDEVSETGVDYMKVSTGLLGLGGTRYIPFSVVREIRSDEIHLSADKDDADRLGWGAPPRTADREAYASTGTATTGATTRGWEAEMPRYRQRWEQRAGTRGGRWEEDEPSYRYGWEMHNDPRYRSRSWTEVEPELRRDWETRYRERPWDRAREGVRDAWEERTGATRTDTAGERTVQLREEELRPRKETVEAGEVGVRKEVVSEQKTMEVPVTHEEVVVERHPVERRPAGGEIGTGADQTIRVPVQKEQVELDKETVVREELQVGKRQVQDTEQVSGTVRREEARVENEGDVDVRRDEPRRDRR